MRTVGSPILIDGAHGEGGSALFRTALALAAITQQPVRIDSVRGGTKLQGLTLEDLTVTKAIGQSCSAEISGAQLGSTTLSFWPSHRPKGLKVDLDASDSDGRGFANAQVILNALIPVLAGTGVYSSLTVFGETFGLGALGYDSFANVTLKAYRALGIYAFPELRHAGWGRFGKGEVFLDLEPSRASGFSAPERSELKLLRAIITTSDLSSHVGTRAISHLQRLASHAGSEIDVTVNQVSADDPGAFVTVWGEYSSGVGGGAAMGQKGIRIESVAQQAFQQWMDYHQSKSTLDPYVADQILVGCALAEGETEFSVMKLTDRFLTMVWVIKQFLPIHLTVKGVVGGPGIVKIRR
ncbi:MAG TPA: RNA 3'-terminal phosphate cyclase [Fimbriimonadaceae bacterium]|nr:RNA 3'-terminal phosphate cyclase [Fimbriimonadaceae bacterium]